MGAAVGGEKMVDGNCEFTREAPFTVEFPIASGRFTTTLAIPIN